MTESGKRAESPNATELDILRSFGWALIESEEILYQRFLQFSASRSLITHETFRSLLRRMEAKGYVSSLDLHGSRAFKKMLVESLGREKTRPMAPLDEMRLALGSLRAKPRKAKRGPTKITSELIEKSEIIGQDIQGALERWMLRESGRISKAAVHLHMANMRDALAESEEALFEYVRTEVPGILAEIGKLLRSVGPDSLLLSLRLTEMRVRKYRY